MNVKVGKTETKDIIEGDGNTLTNVTHGPISNGICDIEIQRGGSHWWGVLKVTGKQAGETQVPVTFYYNNGMTETIYLNIKVAPADEVPSIFLGGDTLYVPVGETVGKTIKSESGAFTNVSCSQGAYEYCDIRLEYTGGVFWDDVKATGKKSGTMNLPVSFYYNGQSYTQTLKIVVL